MSWLQNFVDNVVDKFKIPGMGLAGLIGAIGGIVIVLWIRWRVNKDHARMNQDG